MFAFRTLFADIKPEVALHDGMHSSRARWEPRHRLKLDCKKDVERVLIRPAGQPCFSCWRLKGTALFHSFIDAVQPTKAIDTL